MECDIPKMTNYDLTNLTNVTQAYDVIRWVNDTSKGLFIGGTIIAIWIIALVAITNKYEFPQAMTVASFGAMIIASIFTYAQLLNFLYPLFFLVCTALGVLFIYMNR